MVSATVALALGSNPPAVTAQSEAVREGTCADAHERFPDRNPGPGSLKQIPVPEPANRGEHVRDRAAAIVLGKALFWDMQVGRKGGPLPKGFLEPFAPASHDRRACRPFSRRG